MNSIFSGIVAQNHYIDFPLYVSKSNFSLFNIFFRNVQNLSENPELANPTQ